MLLFISLVLLDNAYPEESEKIKTTFCVCSGSGSKTNCSQICSNFQKINFQEKSIRNVIKQYNQTVITFMIAGTSPDSPETMPKFDLNLLSNISTIFRAFDTQKQEHIIISNGTVGKKTNHLFSYINIHLLNGHYKFGNLEMNNCNFTVLPLSSKKEISFSQKSLIIDFITLINIPSIINYHGPTHGLSILCDEKVNNIHFSNKRTLILSYKNILMLKENKNKNTVLYVEKKGLIDLSQIVKKHGTTITLHTRELNVTFDPMPTSKSDFPNVTFRTWKSCKVFINSPTQFPDNLMMINEIVFNHGGRTLYFDAPEGFVPPSFRSIGSGSIYSNQKKVQFKKKYCICVNKDQKTNVNSPDINNADRLLEEQSISRCVDLCGDDLIIDSYDIKLLDETVVGNPSMELTYIIAKSSQEKGMHPIFDLEHFGNRNLTLIGSSPNDIVEFIGDATDDVGFFNIFHLSMIGKNLLFPDVHFNEVAILHSNKKKDNKNSEDKGKANSDIKNSYSHCYLKSNYLKLDYQSLTNIVESRTTIAAPLRGMEIHTTNVLEEVSLTLKSPNRVRFNKLATISILPHTTLKIFTSGNVYFYLSPYFPRIVTSVPKMKIYLEGDKSLVMFPGENWPSKLSDISVKVTLVHNENPVYITGEIDPSSSSGSSLVSYKSKPPTVDHEGTGPIFFNGKLANYATSYCICDEIINEDGTNDKDSNDKDSNDKDSNDRDSNDKDSNDKDSKDKDLNDKDSNDKDSNDKDSKKIDSSNKKKNNNKCTEICVNHGPMVGFKESTIAETILNNPTKIVEYFVTGTSPDNRPFFGLHSFQAKSFIISGDTSSFDDNHKMQFIALEGTNDLKQMTYTSVSHSFSNLNILLSNPGVYFFNNAVFTNCVLSKNMSSKNMDKNDNENDSSKHNVKVNMFKIIQSGMTTDLISLKSFNENDAIVPSHTYLTVQGNKDLSSISIEDQYNILLSDKDGGISAKADVSLLKQNPATLITIFHSTKTNPFIIKWNPNCEIKTVKEMPTFNLDVSGIDESDDVYVQFVGRKWIGEFHNISEKVTITHGQTNIHILSENYWEFFGNKNKEDHNNINKNDDKNDNKKIEKKEDENKVIKLKQPPHVTLIGIGDYYINDDKQISMFEPGIHDFNSDDDEDDEKKSAFWVASLKVLIVVLILCGLGWLSWRKLCKQSNSKKYGTMGDVISNNFPSDSNQMDESLNDLQMEKFEKVEDK